MKTLVCIKQVAQLDDEAGRVTRHGQAYDEGSPV